MQTYNARLCRFASNRLGQTPIFSAIGPRDAIIQGLLVGADRATEFCFSRACEGDLPGVWKASPGGTVFLDKGDLKDWPRIRQDTLLVEQVGRDAAVLQGCLLWSEPGP